MQNDSAQNNSNDRLPDRDSIQRRAWKIVLAIFLIWIAVSSTSDATDFCLVPDGARQGSTWQGSTGSPIQYDGFTPLPDRYEHGYELGLEGFGPLVAYVELRAELANFDADVDPDGWRAAVVLRSRDGLLLATPSHATFEILEHARSSHRLSTGPRVAHSTPMMRWTMPLVFDEQKVATVTLPASRSVQSAFGWDSIGAHQIGAHQIGRDRRGKEQMERRRVERTFIAGNRRFSGGRMSRLTGPRYNQHFVTLDLHDAIDFPTVGWLRVRVTIPGQQSVQAAAPIDLRPPVLVDVLR